MDIYSNINERIGTPHAAIAMDMEPSKYTDDEILEKSRELGTLTRRQISVNGVAQFSLSESHVNIDYLLNKEKIIFALKSDFPTLASVDDVGAIVIHEGKKYVFVDRFRTLNERQFYFAAQVAHFRIHVGDSHIEKSRGGSDLYFPKSKIPTECFRQASLYAFGLLVPKTLQNKVIQLKPGINTESLVAEIVNDTLVPEVILKKQIDRLRSHEQRAKP